MSDEKRKALQVGAIEKLKLAVPFEEGELSINKRGKLSDKQQERLKPKVDLIFFLTVLATVVAALITVAIYFASLNQPNFFSLAVILGLLTLAAAVLAGWGFYLKMQWLRKEGVRKVTGYANLRIAYYGEENDVPNYQLEINGVKFKLSEEIYSAFIGANFRVFYFRLLRKEILSVEAVD